MPEKRVSKIVRKSAKKVRGYTVAPTTTDRLQRAAMRERDIQTGGGCNTRHAATATR